MSLCFEIQPRFYKYHYYDFDESEGPLPYTCRLAFQRDSAAKLQLTCGPEQQDEGLAVGVNSHQMKQENGGCKPMD